MRGKVWMLGVLVIAIVAIAFVQQHANGQASRTEVPRFEPDPLWSQALPNKWVNGQVGGTAVDSHDNVWVFHRPATIPDGEKGASLNPPQSECCIPAPPVLEFDTNGKFLQAWGGPGQGYEWFASEHGILVDSKDNVWLSGNNKEDNQILKFTNKGKFLMQIGHAGKNRGSNDTENLGGPAGLFIYPKTNELFVADGYFNHRVIVFDADTGKYKRHWGAYGHKPDDVDLGRYDPKAPPAQQFRNPVHCADLSVDRLLYVCDRVNDRIQVFKPDGSFVKEAFFNKETLGSGSAWDVAFSRDPQQKYLYLADGENDRVHIIDRQSLEMLTTFGEGGRQPGEFYGVHSIATDSKGNIYTTETYRGQRVQKFVYKGLAPVAKKDQGVVWPKIKTN